MIIRKRDALETLNKLADDFLCLEFGLTMKGVSFLEN